MLEHSKTTVTFVMDPMIDVYVLLRHTFDLRIHETDIFDDGITNSKSCQEQLSTFF